MEAERPLCGAVKVKPGVHSRPQDAGDASGVGYPPGIAADREWSHSGEGRVEGRGIKTLCHLTQGGACHFLTVSLPPFWNGNLDSGSLYIGCYAVLILQG